MNIKTIPIFAMIITFFGLFALSACADSNALSGGAGVSGEATPTISIPPTSDATATLVPTETPVPTPTLGIGSTVTSGDMSMVYVPAGDFIMGSNVDDALAECQKIISECKREWFVDEEPSHTVYLDAFWIDQTEVTNVMYAKCVAAGVCQPSEFPGSYSRTSYYGNPEFADYPMVFVNWDMAHSYCSWAGRRLPSEAEWEKAARGTDGRIYPWGNSISCNEANYFEGEDYCTGDTTKAGSYEAGKSIYGAYDMAGNVWEWVNDFYDPAYYQISPASNPLGSEPGLYRVLRGGSWYGYMYEDRSSERHGVPPFFTNHYIGFRCASSRP